MKKEGIPSLLYFFQLLAIFLLPQSFAYDLRPKRFEDEMSTGEVFLLLIYFDKRLVYGSQNKLAPISNCHSYTPTPCPSTTLQLPSADTKDP